MDLETRMEAAVEIAREAGSKAITYFGNSDLQTREKGKRDVVTAADFASEELIIRRLSDAFPGDGVVAEEGGKREASNGKRWFVDPLDGTLNFSRGIPVWCISIALFEGDYPVVGVVHDPIRQETFYAATGLGAWRDGVQIRCTPTRWLSQSVVHITLDFKDAMMRRGMEDMNRLVGRVMRTRNLGAAALGLAYVAAGRMDAMLHQQAETWDFGAGVVLVREAGGTATDIAGGPFTASSSSVLVAATVPLHGALLDVLRSTETSRVE